jgi:hypothetical protein
LLSGFSGGLDGTGGNRDNGGDRNRACSTISVYFVFSLSKGTTKHPLFAEKSGLMAYQGQSFRMQISNEFTEKREQTEAACSVSSVPFCSKTSQL